jgi:sterol desaturase/sphingolipid hydroxylase (fatty acid hydroxylase superfamily)
MTFACGLLLLGVLGSLLEARCPAGPAGLGGRSGLGRDLSFFAWNGLAMGLAFAWLRVDLSSWAVRLVGPLPLRPLAGLSFPAQLLLALLVLDLVKWCVHILLHRVSFLWEIHRVHHAITELDWLGNWRFHWSEPLLYGLFSAPPLLLLLAAGLREGPLLAYFALETVMGYWNHANLRVRLGPLRYVLNGPHMHAWHHALVQHGERGGNFGVVLSAWDWLFGTAHLPEEEPAAFGHEGMERLPRGFVGQMLLPLGRGRG